MILELETQEEFDTLVVNRKFVCESDLTLKFDLVTTANITALDIDAYSITANGIYASSLKAHEIIVANRIEVEDDIWCHEIKSIYVSARDITSGGLSADYVKANDINVSETIEAKSIKANDIKAREIIAGNISYHAVCFAYTKFQCKSINGRRTYCRHFCLDSEIVFKNND